MEDILETDLARFLGIKRTYLRTIRQENNIEPVGARPVAYTQHQALELITLTVDPDDPQQLLQALIQRLNGTVEKMARVMPNQFRNPRILRVQIVPDGEVVNVFKNPRAEFVAGREIQIRPNHAGNWEIDPRWSKRKMRGARRRSQRPTQKGQA